jgi:hypothetical protein
MNDIPESNEILSEVTAKIAELSKKTQEKVNLLTSKTVIGFYSDPSYNIQKEIKFPILRGVWQAGFEGVKMMLIDDKNDCQQKCSNQEGNCGCTRVLCESETLTQLPRHFHKNSELVTLIHGQYTDEKSGVDLKPGEKAFYPEGYPHAPKFKGLILICWRPPIIDDLTD